MTHRGSQIYNPDFDPRLHLLLAVPTEQQGSIRLQGSRRARPDRLFGVSGCSAWRITRCPFEQTSWDPDHARIVAIQVGAYRDHTVAKCVRWIVVAALLYHGLPEVRQFMPISHPDIAGEVQALADYLVQKYKLGRND